jgi:polar amino acid transport system substrate-binding protein
MIRAGEIMGAPGRSTAVAPRRLAATLLAATLLAVAPLGRPAEARSLDAINQRGAIALCAHPNALPFAAKNGDTPGLQIELGEALAARLGVRLVRHWVINDFQLPRADCDIVLDAIADRAALGETGLRPSRPYQRSGVVLAVRSEDAAVASLDSLAGGKRVGVTVGSMASMVLDRRGIATVPFVFEDEIMTALKRHEIDAAAVTRTSIGYYNLTHPAETAEAIAAFDSEQALNWNVAVGMLRPDDRLRRGIDTALDELLADGTIARIYARYGIEARPPQ